MPLPLTVSCFSKIQIGFTFLVPAHPGSPGKRAVKWLCVNIVVDVVQYRSSRANIPLGSALAGTSLQLREIDDSNGLAQLWIGQFFLAFLHYSYVSSLLFGPWFGLFLLCIVTGLLLVQMCCLLCWTCILPLVGWVS